MEGDNPHVGWHSRGYQPHCDAAGMLQGVTFRLHDSVPEALVERWRDELKFTAMGVPDAERSARLRRAVEAYADRGCGTCYLRDPRVARTVEDALFRFDGERYRLLEWCVMPNHVHILVEEMLGYPFAGVVKAWKGRSARDANLLLGREGRFWMPDYYDRFVRDDAHLAAIRAYIRENPVKAGLCGRAEEWRWSSAGHERCADFSPHGEDAD